MRKRIGEIARGKFDMEKPEVSFEPETLILTAIAGRDKEGAFTIRSGNGTGMKGMVWCDDPRMECLNSQFSGKEAEIHFVYHTKGLASPDPVRGSFFVMWAGGTKQYDYQIQVRRNYFNSSLGEISSLDDFVQLARKSGKEAEKLFYNPGFSGLLYDAEGNKADRKKVLLGRAFAASGQTPASLEEFLIGAGKKEAVRIFCGEKKRVHYDIRESFVDEIRITKEGWGYLHVRLEADGDFIDLTRKELSAENFLGGVCILPYRINASKLHQGKNCGRIRIIHPDQVFCVEITASKGHELAEQAPHINRIIKRHKLSLGKLYVDHLMGKTITSVWSKKSLLLLDELKRLEPGQKIWPLMKSLVLIRNNQKSGSDADRIFSQLEEVCAKEDSGLAFVLYVAKKSRAALSEEETGNLCREITGKIEEGVRSPFLYGHLLCLYEDWPMLLTGLTRANRLLLLWASKRGYLNEYTACQLKDIAGSYRMPDAGFYPILKAAVDENSDRDISLMCRYLIRNGLYGKKYFHWYQLGVESELSINGLYEAYLFSMEEGRGQMLPRTLVWYFQYEVKVPWDMAARLYAAVIACKEVCRQDYDAYLTMIGHFAREQLRQGRINADLAVIYRDLLEENMLPETSYRDLAAVLFTWQVELPTSEIRRVLVYEWSRKNPEQAEVHGGKAVIHLYSDDYILLFERNDGQLIHNYPGFTLKPLLKGAEYLDRCLELCPDNDLYALAYVIDRKENRNLEKRDLKSGELVLASEETGNEFKAALAFKLISYCHTHGEKEEILFLQKQIEYRYLSPARIGKCAEILASAGLFEHAVDLTRCYGYEEISRDARIRLASWLVRDLQEEEDHFALSLCLDCFKEQSADTGILHYLCSHYAGSLEQMDTVWKAGKRNDIKRTELSENILSFVLYTDSPPELFADVYLEYYANGSMEILKQAYLASACRAYLQSETEMSGAFFRALEREYFRLRSMPFVCRIGYLKATVEADTGADAPADRLKAQDAVLSELVRKNRYFAFFRDLPSELIHKYHLYDKTVLEYHTKPGRHVVLHYSQSRDSGEFLEEDMAESYDGIYARAFTMTFGEMINYYVSEEEPFTKTVTAGSRLLHTDLYGRKDGSRYDLLNQMEMRRLLGHREARKQLLDQYRCLDRAVEDLYEL